MKKQVLIATMLTAVATLMTLNAQAQEETIPTRGACVSKTETPSVDNPISGSTYKWGIETGTQGTDWELTPTEGTSVSVTWLKPGTYRFWSQEESQQHCVGPQYKIDVEVSSFNAKGASNGICSASQASSGSTAVDVVSVNLPTDAFCGSETPLVTPIDGWKIESIDNIGLVTPGENAEIGVKLADSGAIANDSYTNTSNAEVVLTYNIIPYIGEVEGSKFEVKITVYPQVNKPTINWGE